MAVANGWRIASDPRDFEDAPRSVWSQRAFDELFAQMGRVLCLLEGAYAPADDFVPVSITVQSERATELAPENHRRRNLFIQNNDSTHGLWVGSNRSVAPNVNPSTQSGLRVAPGAAIVFDFREYTGPAWGRGDVGAPDIDVRVAEMVIVGSRAQLIDFPAPAPPADLHPPTAALTPEHQACRGHHVVQSGDTLEGIAARHYGDFHLYPQIYITNASKIEHMAQVRGLESSGGGRYLAVGLVLCLP